MSKIIILTILLASTPIFCRKYSLFHLFEKNTSIHFVSVFFYTEEVDLGKEVDLGDDAASPKALEAEVDSASGEVGTRFFNNNGGQVSIFSFLFLYR